ncbi:MAG: hypothetical protein IKQ37_06975 [Bacteroidaceae bacterium]|nr:hypothetical protein [Bacteroidaceae bacterium]
MADTKIAASRRHRFVPLNHFSNAKVRLFIEYQALNNDISCPNNEKSLIYIIIFYKSSKHVVQHIAQHTYDVFLQNVCMVSENTVTLQRIWGLVSLIKYTPPFKRTATRPALFKEQSKVLEACPLGLFHPRLTRVLIVVNHG